MARNSSFVASADAALDLCGEWVAHPAPRLRIVREWSRREPAVDPPIAWKRRTIDPPEQAAVPVSVASAQAENRDRNRRLLALLRTWREEPPIPEDFWREFEAQVEAEREHNG